MISPLPVSSRTGYLTEPRRHLLSLSSNGVLTTERKRVFVK
jgi:hypothetical protein